MIEKKRWCKWRMCDLSFGGGCHFSIMFPSIFHNKKGVWDPKKLMCKAILIENEARGGFKKQQDIDFCVNMWMCWFPVPQYCYVHTNGSHVNSSKHVAGCNHRSTSSSAAHHASPDLWQSRAEVNEAWFIDGITGESGEKLSNSIVFFRHKPSLNLFFCLGVEKKRIDINNLHWTLA